MDTHRKSLHWKVSNFFNRLLRELNKMQIYSHTLQNLKEWTIQLGTTRRHSHAHYRQKIKVKKVIPHPQYSQYVAHDNDIALFQVK
jgi:Trypsin